MSSDLPTGDFHGDRECVTHHACDCILAERDRYREALARLAEAARTYALEAQTQDEPPSNDQFWGALEDAEVLSRGV